MAQAAVTHTTNPPCADLARSLIAEEGACERKASKRSKALKTFAQLRAASDAASGAYDAAPQVQGEADTALFALRKVPGAGYEQADGYADVRIASDRAASLADKPCRAHILRSIGSWRFRLWRPTNSLSSALVAEFSVLCPDDHDDLALAFIHSTLEALRTARTCPPDPEVARAWNEAMASYSKAQTAVGFRSEASWALYLKADLPERQRAPSLHYEAQCKWRNEGDLIDDLLIASEIKAELLPILRDYLLSPESHVRLINADDAAAVIEADKEATGILNEVLWKAECRLMDLPAADEAAMAWKGALVERGKRREQFRFRRSRHGRLPRVRLRLSPSGAGSPNTWTCCDFATQARHSSTCPLSARTIGSRLTRL